MTPSTVRTGARAALAHTDERPATVLIIDDVLANVQLIAAILDRAGYDIQFATSGSEALANLAERDVDLILLDIMMPGLDGYEICRRIKADPATADIPVVFISAKSSLPEKLAGFQAGGVDYITKPFEGQELLVRVATHVNLRQTTQRLEETNRHLEDILEARTRDLVRSERQAAFGQLVQGIVHNLRGPLSTTTIGADMLGALCDRIEAGLDDRGIEGEFAAAMSQASKTVGLMQSSGEAMADMLETLLSRSRTDREEDQKLFDLNEVVTREINFRSADAVFKHQIHRVVDLTDRNLPVCGIASDIAQALGNLLSNARDALVDEPNPRIKVSTWAEGNEAVLSVADNGPGIPPDKIEQIFDPFFTTKPSADDPDVDPDKPTGTGLGLWTVQEAVTAAGGSVTVRSEVGEGVEFVIRIPMSSEALCAMDTSTLDERQSA